MQLVLEVDQFPHLALEQFGDRHAGPLGDDAGDLFLADLFIEHRAVALQLAEGLVLLLQLASSLGISP